ncbi:hypothetical protein OPQ81_005575 [Rhizoctonia solani]|nr:hypothetical protein OPQ81_005575 [Rhizoctonia solani]
MIVLKSTGLSWFSPDHPPVFLFGCMDILSRRSVIVCYAVFLNHALFSHVVPCFVCILVGPCLANLDAMSADCLLYTGTLCMHIYERELIDPAILSIVDDYPSRTPLELLFITSRHNLSCGYRTVYFECGRCVEYEFAGI